MLGLLAEIGRALWSQRLDVVPAQTSDALVEGRRIEVDEDDARYDVVCRFGTGEFDGPRVSVAPVSGFVGGGGVG
jgi:hypothetical protein